MSKVRFKKIGDRPTLKPGEDWFCVKYLVSSTFGYRIIIAATDLKAARKYFNDHWNATLHSIKKGAY